MLIIIVFHSKFDSISYRFRVNEVYLLIANNVMQIAWPRGAVCSSYCQIVEGRHRVPNGVP